MWTQGSPEITTSTSSGKHYSKETYYESLLKLQDTQGGGERRELWARHSEPLFVMFLAYLFKRSGAASSL